MQIEIHKYVTKHIKKYLLFFLTQTLCRRVVTNPAYELPSTHHQSSPAHHMDSCTTQTVTCHYMS